MCVTYGKQLRISSYLHFWCEAADSLVLYGGKKKDRSMMWGYGCIQESSELRLTPSSVLRLCSLAFCSCVSLFKTVKEEQINTYNFKSQYADLIYLMKQIARFSKKLWKWNLHEWCNERVPPCLIRRHNTCIVTLVYLIITMNKHESLTQHGVNTQCMQ